MGESSPEKAGASEPLQPGYCALGLGIRFHAGSGFRVWELAVLGFRGVGYSEFRDLGFWGFGLSVFKVQGVLVFAVLCLGFSVFKLSGFKGGDVR